MAKKLKISPGDFGITVKPHGAHGKKVWAVCRNGKVVLTAEKNSEACTLAAEMALTLEEGQQQGEKLGEKKGAAAEKKKTAVGPTLTIGTGPKPPVALRGTAAARKAVKKTTKKGGKKR